MREARQPLPILAAHWSWGSGKADRQLLVKAWEGAGWGDVVTGHGGTVCPYGEFPGATVTASSPAVGVFEVDTDSWSSRPLWLPEQEHRFSTVSSLWQPLGPTCPRDQ